VVLDHAKSAASAQHKAIFLIFRASWCSWCGSFDRFIAMPEVQPIMGKYFVPAWLTVKEHGAKALLDNPGGAEERNRLGGGNAGLRFFAFLDANGELIVNSLPPVAGRPAMNIGDPRKPEEVEWFLLMVKKAAPVTPEQSAVLERCLRRWRR
jgi:hypothetical protein